MALIPIPIAFWLIDFLVSFLNERTVSSIALAPFAWGKTSEILLVAHHDGKEIQDALEWPPSCVVNRFNSLMRRSPGKTTHLWFSKYILLPLY